MSENKYAIYIDEELICKYVSKQYVGTIVEALLDRYYNEYNMRVCVKVMERTEGCSHSLN